MKVVVIVHPNAKNPRIEIDLLETMHVYVTQPPLEGKANMAVIAALADYFKVKKSSILLLSGEKSKQKAFEVLKEK